MLVEFSFDQRARAVFQGQLDDLRRRGVSMHPALAAVADDFLELEEQVFETQGRRIGATWRPLAEWWRRYRETHGLGTKILRYENARGGRLYRSLTQRGAPWQLRHIDADSVTVGTTLGIAPTHQKGGSATVPTRGGQRQIQVPRRRFVQLRLIDKHRWIAYQQEFLMTGRVQRGILRGL